MDLNPHYLQFDMRCANMSNSKYLNSSAGDFWGIRKGKIELEMGF